MSTCFVKLSRKDKRYADESYLFLEDYIREPNITEARELTDQIFSNNRNFVARYDYEGYKVTWSWYDTIYQSMLDFLKVSLLLNKIESINPRKIILVDIPNNYAKVIERYFIKVNVEIQKKSKFLQYFKEFIYNLILLFFTFISLIYFYFRRGNSIATRSEDYIFKGTKSDFRLNHLYDKYKENNIQYIDFVRNTSSKDFFINIIKRKRFAIYYTSIIYFVNLLTKKTTYELEPLNFHQSILCSYHYSNIVLIRSIPLMKKLLKILRINKFVLITFSSRSAHLAIASKSLNIPIIGIMHGLSQKEYDANEFMESYYEDRKIGCDVYGVWSEHYLDYFKKYSKISNKESFQYSGLLRPVKNFDKVHSFNRISKNKIKVLLISEPLVAVSEIIPYLKYLLENKYIEVGVKVRPMVKDMYYENMKLEFPEIQNLKVFGGKLKDVANNFDVFIGSNSTAVIEASLFGKISILLKTMKFGDYFDIDELTDSRQFLVKDPKVLCKEIQFRVNNESDLKTIEKTRHRFFGDNKDGAQWVVDQL